LPPLSAAYAKRREPARGAAVRAEYGPALQNLVVLRAGFAVNHRKLLVALGHDLSDAESIPGKGGPDNLRSGRQHPEQVHAVPAG